MKILCIIQARMGSTRLPGKVFMDICGKPILIHVINRIKKCRRVNDIIVATTNKEKDDVIVNLLEKNHIKYYRGSEEDVLERYYKAAIQYEADIIVRVTSDDPLIDYRHVDMIIEKLLQEKADYSCNNWIKTYPYGLDVECFTLSALTKAYLNAKDSYEREHVTLYIREKVNKFKIVHFEGEKDLSSIRLTIDTEEDFQFVKNIYEGLYEKNPDFVMEDIIELLQCE